MEGILAVPPDRGTIIGRALWKPRFVVIGSQKRSEQAGSSNKEPPLPENTYLTVYKSRSEWEPIQQYHISSITDCQVQMVAHRKQGPVLPTLVITFSPDPATDKLRKRRSSRAAGLTSSKDNAANMLWFRSGDDNNNLHDWARYIQAHMMHQTTSFHHPEGPMSPVTPASPTFTNPFSPRQRDPSEYYTRPPSGHHPSASGRGTLQHKGSTQTHSSRDRPTTYSGSPSLRSKRSDISSHASVMNQHGSAHHYGSMHPADLPSPATTVGDYHGEFIEGWTTAQGRSSTLSSPIRGRDSIGSQAMSPPPVPTAIMDSSSPPGPRETILDRAFQMRCIPGSENEVPGEEKLSSLARFEALMKDMDRKRERREAHDKAAAQQAPASAGLQSGWDSDDSDDSEDNEDNEEYDHRRSASSHPAPRMMRAHSYGHPSHGHHSYSKSQGSATQAYGHEEDLDEDVLMPPGAQRALEFITGRSSPAMSPRSPPVEHFGSQYGNSGSSSHLRQDFGPRKQSGIAQKTTYNRQPEVVATASGGNSSNNTNGSYVSPVLRSVPHMVNAMAPQHRQPTLHSSSGKSTPTELGMTAAAMASSLSLSSRRTNAEKRLSSSSSKRLSFTELTKRLSGTGSLLMGQSNVGKNGGGNSYDAVTTDAAVHGQYHQQQPVQSSRGLARGGVPPPAPAERERCGWRGSVGVGTDGGFL